MNHPPGSYDALLAWALAAPMSGWDFDPVAGRILEKPPPWDYPALARTLVRAGGGPVLDLGTGGGEVLAGLAPLPDRSAATEAWTPNLPVARARLAPLGIRVYPTGDDLALPFPANTFAVVLARHERYDPVEVRRVLRPGGAFLTQQVSSRDGLVLRAALGTTPRQVPGGVELGPLVQAVTDAGLVVARQEVHDGRRRFTDVGALVWYARRVPWQLPGFDPARSEPAARAAYQDGGRRTVRRRRAAVAHHGPRAA